MVVTEAQAQALIIATVGDVDPATGEPPDFAEDGLLALNMPTMWASYAAQETVAPGLQRLMTERHAYLMVLGVIRRAVDLKAGSASLALSQQAKSILDALKMLDEQIIALQKSYSGGVPVSGVIQRTAPVMPCDVVAVPAVIDANDPRLSGSPYRPSWPGGRP